MKLRVLGVFTLMLLLAGGAATQGLAQTPKPEPAPAAKKDIVPPIVFFVAKGEPDACGKGCDTWIAAEGEIDKDAASRFRKFLRQLKRRDLPLYFSSPGGNVDQGIAMGAILREKPATVRIARSVVKECEVEKQTSRECIKIKQSGRELPAELVTRGAICNSSCTFVILGGTRREVPYDVSPGIHSPKVIITAAKGSHPTAVQRATYIAKVSDRLNRSIASHTRKMGVDIGMYDLMRTVKYEDIHRLTREEMYRFRIDTRESVETAWSLETTGRPLLNKSAWAKAPDASSFRRIWVRFYCESDNRALVLFLREAEKDGTSPATISLTAGADKPIMLTKRTRSDAFLSWGAILSSDAMKVLLATPQLQIAEPTWSDDKAIAKKFEIETFGLEHAWTRLSAICRSPSAAATPL